MSTVTFSRSHSWTFWKSMARVQRTLAAIPRNPPSRNSLRTNEPVSTSPIVASPRSFLRAWSDRYSL